MHAIEPPPTVTFSRLLLWLLLLPVILMMSCVIGGIASATIMQIIPLADSSPEYSLVGRIFWSLSVGSVTTLLIGFVWEPPIRLTEWRVIALSILAISSSFFATLTAIGDIPDTDALPMGWILPTLGIGIVMSLFHWYLLRHRARRAGWWIPVMIGSWIVLWFVAVAWVWNLGD